MMLARLKGRMLDWAFDLYSFMFSRTFFYQLNKLLYLCALRGMGILNHKSDTVSGEAYFLRWFLADKEMPIIIDVGANIGEYAKKVLHTSSKAKVFAFEPHPTTFLRLCEVSARHGFQAFNVGCGDVQTVVSLYDYADSDGSTHASIIKGVIEQVHHSRAVSHRVDIVRLDDFATRLGLTNIDLLKVDTEGNELAVLKGFEMFIKQGRVKAIQFEFNEMNVVSHVFFRDFYDFLQGYRFYRMVRDGLVPINGDSPLLCEIYAYQNVIAMRE